MTVTVQGRFFIPSPSLQNGTVIFERKRMEPEGEREKSYDIFMPQQRGEKRRKRQFVPFLAIPPSLTLV